VSRRLDLDPAELGAGIYPWLTSVVVPRPIAWVSSRSVDGVDNLAPHSFFTVAGIDPPVVQFTSVGVKDSLRNVLATGEFVVCLTPEPLVEQVNLTGTDFPADVSEYDAVAGLTREPSSKVAPPGSPSHQSPSSACWPEAGSSAVAPSCSAGSYTWPSRRTSCATAGR